MSKKHIFLYKSKYSDVKVSRISENRILGYDEDEKAYKGISKTANSEYIIIKSYEEKNKKNYGYIVTPEEAVKEILKANKADLFKTYKFKDLLDFLNSAID